MIAAVYSRKSKFTGKGESIENQVQLCREYCNTHGIEVYDVYEDEGFTGANLDRPEFQRMLKDAKKKNFNVLICYRLDRVSRNIVDFSTLIEDLEALEINFISLREQFDTTTPMGRAMMYISSVFAQLERETIAERIKDNMHQLARTGRWLGGQTPLGYGSEPIVYYDDQMKHRQMYKLKPVSNEIELVKTIYTKFLELDGIYKLQGHCYTNDLKSRKGNNFDIASLQMILTNPVYVVADELIYEYCISRGMDVAAEPKEFDGMHGIIAYNKRHVKKGSNSRINNPTEWIIAVGKHKGIISSKDWIHAQNIFERGKLKPKRSGTSVNALLSTLLVCGECNSKMKVQYKVDSGKKYYYYKCGLKIDSRCTLCNTPNISGPKAEQLVIGELKKIALNKSVISKGYVAKQNELKSDLVSATSDRNNLTNEQKEIENQIQNLATQLSQNSSSTAAKYIIKQMEVLDAELTDIKKKIGNTEEMKENALLKQMNIEILKQNLEHFLNNFDNLNFEDQKKLLKNLINYVLWDGKILKIKLLEE